LPAMTPYERRIIHMSLMNDPSVTTHSEGDEPERHVVVTFINS
jgi:spoIIIJ-associated protein